MKKTRRINPIEQHFEKVILGAVSAVLLGVVSMQFLTQPNAVRVGNSPSPVPPDRVFETIKTDADELLAKMRNVDPALPEVPEQDVATQFARVSGLAAADAVRVTRFGTDVKVEQRTVGEATAETATIYAMPALPVPTAPAGATFRATIDPIEATANEALRGYLPAQQPYDTVAVSVEGLISGELLRQSLEVDPDGDQGPTRPLPLSWWRGNLDLLGVEVERQELGADGAWGGQTIIAGVPGEVSLLEEARTGGITPAALVEVAQHAQGYMRQIAQPEFPATIAGPDWVRPSELQEGDFLSDEDRDIARLQKRLETYDRQIAAKQKQIEEVGGGGGGVDLRREESGGGGGGRRSAGGGGGGQPSQRTTVDRDQQRRDQLQRDIDTIERNRQRTIDDLADLGVSVENDQDQNQPKDETEQPLPTLLDAEDLPVWVHDFGVEPGKTYRYRMRVVLNNPLYAKEQYLAETQQSVASSPTIEGGWSAWTAPVEVERDRHFFVVSASESDQIGNGPRAAVEVYQFYYGYWRKGSTTLEPGDSIHASAKLPDGLLIWDVERLKTLGRRPGPAGIPRGTPGIEDPGRRRNFEENERQFREQETRGREQPTTRTEEGELPEGAERAPDSLNLEIAALLLDVSELPGEDQGVQAVLRGPDGAILTRDAAADRSGVLYRRLAANAREGVTQGQPEPEPNERQAPLPQPGQRDRPSRDDGGGGGGGG